MDEIKNLKTVTHTESQYLNLDVNGRPESPDDKNCTL
jgi:hypothetical protein